MKRHGNLYEGLSSFQNLLKAAQKAQKGKRAKPNVARFNFHLEGELLRLQSQLRQKTLRLRLHPAKCQVFPTSGGTSFLGYRLFPTHRLLRRDNAQRFRRRLQDMQAQYRRGALDFNQVDASLQSWLAHARHADTFGLRRALLKDVAFQKRGTVD